MAVGRDPSSAIHVNDDAVSWHHAELVRRGPSWSIVDARSTNGTFVNDERAAETVLHADDRIRLGHIELVVKQPGLDPQTRQGTARVALAYAPELRPGGFSTAVIHSGTVVAPVLPESAILSEVNCDCARR